MAAHPNPPKPSDRRLNLSLGWCIFIIVELDDVSWNGPVRGGRVLPLVQVRVVHRHLLQISTGGVCLFSWSVLVKLLKE